MPIFVVPTVVSFIPFVMSVVSIRLEFWNSRLVSFSLPYPRFILYTLVADAFSKTRGHRCVLLDLGGTLVDRESTSIYTKYDFHGTSRRLPSASVLASIGKLASDPQTTVVVISGQTKSAMARTLGRVAPLGLVAETGMFYSWGVSSVAKSDDEKKADSSVTSKVCS